MVSLGDGVLDAYGGYMQIAATISGIVYGAIAGAQGGAAIGFLGGVIGVPIGTVGGAIIGGISGGVVGYASATSIKAGWIGLSEIVKKKANRTNKRIESLGGIDGVLWGNCNTPVSPPYPHYIPKLDPSGYVYEAVESNRVYGATATVIQRVTKLDMYDEEYTEDEVWSASEYGQTNPQTTNEIGEFAWDVPDGLWSITVTKPGYEDAQTDWMTVPPERKDVRIGLVSLEKPVVLNVTAQDEGYLITFSKYVWAEQIAGAVTLTADGRSVPLTLTVVNGEQSPKKGKLVATQLLAVPSEPLDLSGNVLLTVSGAICSYADISMGDDYVYNLGEQLTEIVAPESVELLNSSSMILKLKLYPVDQAMGRKVTAFPSNDSVSINSSAIVDDNGEALFYLKMNDSGNAVITYEVSGSSLTAQTNVTCSVDPLSFNTLRLPAYVTVIEEEAFSGIAAITLIIPESCERIESNAFADCPFLQYVIIPANSSVQIAEDAFGDKDVIIIRK